LTVAIGVIVLAVLPACQQEQTSEAKPTGVGEYTAAPDFTLPDLNGTKVSLSDYRGKVVLLNFWATWCPPCRLEMPTMEEAYRKYKDQGFAVVAVSVDTGPTSAIQDFLHEFGLTFQILLDPQMETLKSFDSFSLPTTIVIDRQGFIRARELGYRNWTDEQSTALITDLLNEPSAR
jgi:cytochrome c biogenesis protein CcmG, thiol:disulfide interchange protein DsbE